jgi:ferric-dicitrate binding protein FerR (iron transport regulator)
VQVDTMAVIVTLVEGKVNILNLSAAADLLPNQQAVIRSGSENINTADVNVSQYTAWVSNRLIFENVPLSEAFVTLENWYNVDIDIDSGIINDCVITGKYENESLENVLNSFSFMLKMDYKINNHHVAVNGKGCN